MSNTEKKPPQDDKSGREGKKNKSKKEAQFVIRLEKDLRDRFVDACQDIDTTAARELRGFIKRFLKRYERGEYDESK